MSRRRSLAMKLRHHHYVRRELGLSGFCVYCGQIADSLDHVPPISLAADLPLPAFLDLNPSLLPCCQHCNSIIGDSHNLSLSSRREIVEKYLEKRYPSLLKAGALLAGVEFSMSDFRPMMAFRIFKRWEFATTTFIEIPPPEVEEIGVETDEAAESGEPNTKDCCMPFPLWCNSWQISDARRIFWQEAMPEYLRDGVRILTVEKDRDLVEKFSAELPEWAKQQAETEARLLKEQEEAALAVDALKKQQKRNTEIAVSKGTDYLEIEDDDEFSRALSALLLRNANGPDSIGFQSRRNIVEISDILQLDDISLGQILQIKNKEKLYLAISERVIERFS